MTFRFAFKTSFGHLQDVLARCLACLGKTSLRYLVDVFLPTELPNLPKHRNTEGTIFDFPSRTTHYLLA